MDVHYSLAKLTELRRGPRCDAALQSRRRRGASGPRFAISSLHLVCHCFATPVAGGPRPSARQFNRDGRPMCWPALLRAAAAFGGAGADKVTLHVGETAEGLPVGADAGSSSGRARASRSMSRDFWRWRYVLSAAGGGLGNTPSADGASQVYSRSGRQYGRP